MRLVVVAHGTRDPAGARTAQRIVDAVADRLPEPVSLAYADVRGPTLGDVLDRVDGPTVVLPAFLAAGYHVRVDLPEQIGDRGDVLLAEPLGPHPLLVAAVHARLVEAGLRRSDAVVLAAAGSSDPRAVADVHQAADLLAERVGRPVRVGFITTASPGVSEAVAAARSAGSRRVAVASWLLAPGLFHRRLAAVGADVVGAPIGAQRALVERVIECYRAALPAVELVG